MTQWGELTERLVQELEVVEHIEERITVLVGRKRVVIELLEALGEPWIAVSAAIGTTKRFDLSALLRRTAGLAIGATVLEGEALRLRHAVPLAPYELTDLELIIELVGREAERLSATGAGSALSALFEQYA